MSDSSTDTDAEPPLDEQTFRYVMDSPDVTALLSLWEYQMANGSPSPASAPQPSAAPSMGFGRPWGQDNVETLATMPSTNYYDSPTGAQAQLPAYALAPEAAMAPAQTPTNIPAPVAAMAPAQAPAMAMAPAQTEALPLAPTPAFTNTELPYVLPHAPPTAPAQVASPVQPSGDRFVESAVNNTIPALEAWPGVHGFRVTVRTPPKWQHGRQQPYVFDAEANKLYVDMNITVTFTFRVADGTDTTRLRVSALPVYPDMHHVNTPVRRCPTHRQPDHEGNAGADGFIDHVIRAEHDNAIYQEMGTTKERRSVVVPYERPQPGTDEYRVSYKFCCMNTCVGGINRRRLVVLFTLEDNSTGTALGRQTIEVKVCKCPHRDARTDQIRRRPVVNTPRLPKRRLEPAAAEVTEPAARRQRTAGRLVVEVDDLDEYDHLVAVLESFRAIRRRRQARPAPGTPAPPPPGPVAQETAEVGEEEVAVEGRASAEVPPPDVHRRPTLPSIKMELL